jgi:hypothetical protein
VINIADDEGATEENASAMPVVVTEVLGEGPGVVNRKYRIEIFSNNRVSMGTIDIANQEDLKRVVGAKHVDLLEPPESERDYFAIFSYIVKERLQLSMMTSAPRPGSAEKRRQGMSKKIAQRGEQGEGVVIGTAGSVISLQRDDIIHVESAQRAAHSDDESNSDDEDDIDSLDNRHHRIWLRLFQRRHKMSGRHFRTLVLFESNFEEMYQRPDLFFQSGSLVSKLSVVDVCFKSYDTLTKEIFELRVPGYEISQWLPINLKVDLGHKFRRGKFGLYLIENLRLRYSIDGKYYLALFNMY